MLSRKFVWKLRPDWATKSKEIRLTYIICFKGLADEILLIYSSVCNMSAMYIIQPNHLIMHHVRLTLLLLMCREEARKKLHAVHPHTEMEKGLAKVSALQTGSIYRSLIWTVFCKRNKACNWMIARN